ncbi:hypothetical protein Tco_0620195 [Tanacetum coccineum]
MSSKESKCIATLLKLHKKLFGLRSSFMGLESSPVMNNQWRCTATMLAQLSSTMNLEFKEEPDILKKDSLYSRNYGTMSGWQGRIYIDGWFPCYLGGIYHVSQPCPNGFYRVAEVLVKEGAVIEAGTRLLTLDILEEEEEVNDNGQTKQKTLPPMALVWWLKLWSRREW